MARQLLMRIEFYRDDAVVDDVPGVEFTLERSSVFGPLQADLFMTGEEMEEVGDAVANSQTFKILSKELTDLECDKLVQFCASDSFLGATPGQPILGIA
jgi:hypothetical protein